jgi:4-hydroxy-2-oxoheptanedioate aldolase
MGKWPSHTRSSAPWAVALLICASGLGALGTLPAGGAAQAAADVRLNRTIELLASGRPALGVLAFDYSLNNARALARSGLDFIIIDMEHSPYDVEQLRLFLLGMTDKRAIQQKGNLQMDVTPFVRIPATGQEDILAQAKQVLDVGVFGVMYPSISTREQAETAVRATRYPQQRGAPDFEPAGLRGRNPANAAWFWGVNGYEQRADVWPLDPGGELLAILQIETEEGLANVEEIASVPGVGVIFIGPSDLTAALGFPPAAEVEAAIQRILSACLAAGVPCAITTGANTVEERLRQGFRFMTVGADGGISSGVEEALERARAMPAN